jgi:hypothetical protein
LIPFLGLESIALVTLVHLRLLVIQNVLEFVSVNSDVLEVALGDLNISWGGQGGDDNAGKNDDEFHFDLEFGLDCCFRKKR